MHWYQNNQTHYTSKKDNIVKTAIFELDHNVFNDIEQHIINTYKEFNENLKQRVDTRTIPPKTFPLNFSNSRYQFLEQYNPTILVSFFYKQGASVGYFQHGNSEIQMNLAYPLARLLISTLEHELLHYVQRLISMHAKRTDPTSNIELGGLPPENVIDRSRDVSGRLKKFLPELGNKWYPVYIYDPKGREIAIPANSPQEALKKFKKKYTLDTVRDQRGNPIDQSKWSINNVQMVPDESRAKRGEHHNRPVEYMTNLNTIIRQLQYALHHLREEGVTANELFRSIMDGNTMQLFNQNQNPVPAGMKQEIDWDLERLQKVKKSNKKLYDFYMKKIYTELNKDFDTSKFEQYQQIEQGIKNTRQEKIRQQEEIKNRGSIPIIENEKGTMLTSRHFDEVKKIQFDSLDRADFSDLEDGNYDFAIDHLTGLSGGKELDKYWGAEIMVPITWKKLLSHFKKIKGWRDSSKESLNTYITVDGGNNYDFFAKTLIKYVSEKLGNFDVDEFYNKYYLQGQTQNENI